MRAPADKKRILNLNGEEAPIAYRDLILSHSDVEAVTVCRYKTPPFLQQRINMSYFEEKIIETALGIRSEAKIPFWEAIFSACLSTGKCSDSLLDAALFHSGFGELTKISAKAVESNELVNILSGGSSNIGLASRIELKNGEHYHISMMDFHCPVMEDNTEIVAAICHRLMPDGFLLLDSGDSYHACGAALLNDNERLECLAKSLFYSPIVDTHYVAHQLLQPMSSIRISIGGSRMKSPKVLRVEISA